MPHLVETQGINEKPAHFRFCGRYPLQSQLLRERFWDHRGDNRPPSPAGRLNFASRETNLGLCETKTHPLAVLMSEQLAPESVARSQVLGRFRDQGAHSAPTHRIGGVRQVK